MSKYKMEYMVSWDYTKLFESPLHAIETLTIEVFNDTLGEEYATLQVEQALRNKYKGKKNLELDKLTIRKLDHEIIWEGEE